MIYRFGAFELDEQAGELRRAGTSVPIQPKPLALLQLLLRERERIVSQDEIFEALWPGTAVTPGSLTRAVSHARRAIDDTHKGSLLRSFPRRGYRFVADVVEVGGEPAATAAAPAPGAADAMSADAVRSSASEVFVGREDGLGRLHAAHALSGRKDGRIVLVSGAAGVGKTRLVEVFSEEATARGALVVVGRSRDGEGVPAYWLWSQVLQQLANAGLAAEGGGFEELLIEAGRSSDPDERFLFFDAVARALVSAARARPLVIVLEDLQWARSTSLRLLEHLCFELDDARLLIIGTIRTETRERGHPVDRALGILGRHDRCEQVELAGLSRGAIGELLKEVIGRPAPTELTSELFARTEGVPLFVREAVRLLDERGELRRPERIRRHGISLPSSVIDLIRRSLDGLSEDGSALVAAGAVLGREFTSGSVAAVADLDRGVALDLLEEVVAAGVLEELPETAASFRFTHALFQEAALGALSAGQRARLHARAAARLESQHQENPGAVIAELAHHHHQSIAVGDPERAFERALAAAREAERVLAFEQAATHYEQALDALGHFETIDATRRLTTLIELGEAHRRAGDRNRRREVSAQAMEGARALGRTREFALAAIRFCDVNEWSPHDEAADAAIEEALAGIDPSDVALSARLTSRRAYLGVRESGARDIAREAAELARRSGDPATLQEALYVRLYTLAGPDHIEERRALAQELADAARQLRSRDSAVIALLDVACDHLTLGDRESADGMRAEIDDLVGRHLSLGISWHTQVFDTGCALLEGRIEDTEQMMMDALLTGKRIHHPYAQACFNGQLMQLYRYRREYEAIRPLFERAHISQLGPNHWARAVAARNELALGNLASAEEIWEGLAASDFADVERGIRWVGTILELAHLCADLDDSARAKPLISLLSADEHLHGVLPVPILYGGPATYALARLHEMLGSAETAISYYEEALEAATQLGARPLQARIQLDMAGPIRRRGNASRSSELEAEGQRLADEIGCHL